MSDIGISAEMSFLLDGQTFNAPIEWEDITIEAIYKDDNVQPSLTIENFTFPLKARVAINKWISDGFQGGGVGIFEGMPFQLTIFNNQDPPVIFKAFIDFTNGYKDLTDDGKVEVSIIKDSSLSNFFEQLEGTTYGYLEEIGVVGLGDYTNVDYVNEKKFNLLEILISAVILFLMIKELIEAIDRLINAVVQAIAHISGGISGSIAGALYAIAKAILIIIYVAILLAAVIELGNKLLETLVPKVRQHKTIKLRRALELVANHFGYGFSSPISELEDVFYLPSNPNLDEKTAGGFISVTKGTQSGIPFVNDFGYKCNEMFNLCKKLFNAKLAIINNTVILRTRNDPFWINQATWVFPSILLNTLEYNTDELKADRLLTFRTDLNDEWTIDNYFGTSFEVRTEPITVINKRAVLLKGLEEINFETALGNRKDELNAIEKFLKEVAGFIDGLTGFFGGGTDFADKIKARVGVLKQSQNWHSIPKLLFLKDGKLPGDHRTKWAAIVLWTKYHIEKSFVSNNFFGQKTVYNNVTIPFGFIDFNQLTDNSYFIFNGSVAKIIKFTWKGAKDDAVINFWVREPYTSNLREKQINPA